MKKFTFALMAAAVMLFAVSPLFAKGMLVGVKGGVNLANFTGKDVAYILGEDPVGVTTRFGGVGSMFVCYNITETFLAIQAEISYSMKGAKTNLGDPRWRALEVSMKLDYIEIPLLLKIRLYTEGKVKPALFIGPSFGFLQKAYLVRAEYDIEEPPFHIPESRVNIGSFIKSMDIGIVIGAGVGYEMGKGLVFVEGRYEAGWSTIWEFGDADVKNGVGSIMAGYGFAR